ncbi:MAG: hypothetical protein KDA81_20475, partial [Planctomycetaceae bacterium]|nr:hypothetical protein [Planctomycetaceae bacterium]
QYRRRLPFIRSQLNGIGSRAQPLLGREDHWFNPMPQARLVSAAINLACGVGLNEEIFTTGLMPFKRQAALPAAAG